MKLAATMILKISGRDCRATLTGFWTMSSCTISRTKSNLEQHHSLSKMMSLPHSPTIPDVHNPPRQSKRQTLSIRSLNDVLSRQAPQIPTLGPLQVRKRRAPLHVNKSKLRHKTPCDLVELVSNFGDSGKTLHQAYSRDLQDSIDSFSEPPEDFRIFDYHRPTAENLVFGTLQTLITEHLRPSSLLEQVLLHAGAWPSADARSLLHQLSQSLCSTLSSDWRSLLCAYAAGLILEQQYLRICKATEANNTFEFQREISNSMPPDLTDIYEWPYWALVQVRRRS